MARSMNTDYLQSMRFHVVISGNTATLDWGTKIGAGAHSTAGFNTVTVPELSIESVEYREGRWNYSRKMPGVPSMGGDISMTRGVVRKDTDFWDWAHIVAEGSGEYRADLDIYHYHRDNALTRGLSYTQNQTLLQLDKPAKIYKVRDAFPTRCKPAGDMDASSSEVSISELDCAYETFWVEDHTPPTVEGAGAGEQLTPQA